MGLVLMFWTDERGATAIEYALLGALFSAVVIVAFGLVSGNLQDLFTDTSNRAGSALTGASDRL